MEWVAQEEIDGSNMQIITNGEKVWFASRSILLDTGKKLKDFFASPNRHKRYEPLALDIHRLLTKSSKETLCIYGEYHDGYYGRGSVIDRYPVKKSVLYSHDFIIFDILFGDRWLSPMEVVSLCEAVGYPYVCRSLHIATLSELLQKEVNYPTTIPEMFRLELLPKLNMAEGFVLKPLERIITWDNGNLLYLKMKREQFCQRNKRKESTNIPEVFRKLTKPEEGILQDMLDMITMERLQSLNGKN